MVHPNRGVYDVVISSTSSELLPEGARVLTNRPIYTVYLPLGTPQHWILQYCAPSEARQNQPGNRYVVQLPNPAPIGAPYPLVSSRLPIRLPPGTKYLVVHGSISAAGRFQQLVVLPGADPQLGRLVLASLADWVFRPATQDGRPVPVEVLLGIPGDHTDY